MPPEEMDRRTIKYDPVTQERIPMDPGPWREQEKIELESAVAELSDYLEDRISRRRRK